MVSSHEVALSGVIVKIMLRSIELAKVKAQTTKPCLQKMQSIILASYLLTALGTTKHQKYLWKETIGELHAEGKKIKTVFHCNTHVTGFRISAEEGSKICLMKEDLAQEKCFGKLILKN